MHFAKDSGVLKSPRVWQSLQATEVCLPSKGNFVFEWSNPRSWAIRCQLVVLWQDSHVALKLPLWGSKWHIKHFAKAIPVYFRYGFAPATEGWHLAQSIFSCAPVSGNFDLAWLKSDAGFQPCTV
jgi:hypothetical protein